ncbi:MAG: DNA-binding response regulator [Crocinitomicaceae bacterium]|jgi:two-component system LytT family response regulator|nr:DNA-binding response regulator [Crocinitomicaceae bacterium]
MKTIIIDDEPLARMLVKEYLVSHPEMEVIAEAEDGFDGVKKINELKPDVVFLDVQMPKLNGFELLELLNHFPQVIFTTAFDEYALKAFESNAVDYLLKPFSEERFSQALHKLKNDAPAAEKNIGKLTDFNPKYEEESSRIVVKNGSEIQILPTRDIDFIEAYDDYVKIYIGEKYHLKKKTLSYYEPVLAPANFLRVHRSFILNLAKLTRIESFEKNSYLAILSSGMRIPISRTSYPVLKAKLGI